MQRGRGEGRARRDRPSLPALAASQEMQERAANLGYDWPSIDGVLDKVVEETEELRVAPDHRRPPGPRSSATCCSCSSTSPARHGIEAEAALRAPTPSSGAGSAASSAMAAEHGVALRDLDFDALDELWDAAKARGRRTER